MKKQNTNLLIRNVIVSLGLLLFSCIFFWLFWSELYSSVQNTEGEVVGEIVAIRGQAQRRYVSQAQWGSLRSNEVIYNQDAIRTANNGNASIVLRTVSTQGEVSYDEIELGPDTYIILDLTETNRKISFIAGDIFAKGENGLSIEAEGTVIDTDGTVRVTRQEGQSTSVAALEGEAKVTIDGQETIIDDESNIQIDEVSHQITQYRNSVVLLSPAPNDILLTFDNVRNVDFSWKLMENWTNNFLEVSTNPEFVNDTDTKRINADTSNSLQLQTGTWYWRITNDDTGYASAFHSFNVRSEQEVRIYSPGNNLNMSYGNDIPSVNFQWTSALFADMHVLEISRSTNFSNPAIRKETLGSSVLVSDLAAGEWWWRVLPVYQRAELAENYESQVYRFNLERRLQHEAVFLLFPVDRSKISALDAINGVDFRWKKEEGISSYKISIASDPGFTELVAVEEVTENWKILMEEPEVGTYYWKVEAAAADDLPVPPSPVRAFEIEPIEASIDLLSPPPGNNIALEPYEPYTFIWQSVIPGTVHFLLQRQDGFARTTIVDNLLQGDRFTMFLPGGGTYEWQIEILDNNRRSLAQSQKGLFNIRSPFLAPLLVSPTPGESIELSGTRDMEVSWTSIPEANAYNILIRSPNGAIIDNAKVAIPRRELTLPNNVGPGIYRVELTAEQSNTVDDILKTSQTASYSFQISSIVTYNAAVPSSPQDRAVFQIASTAVSGIPLRWTQRPQLARWTIELSDGQNTWIYESNRTSLNLRGLVPGNYTWLVHSWDSSGQEAPSSRQQRFTIQDYLVPNNPRVTYPETDQVIDMTGQTRLEFRWQSASPQASYDLTIRSEDDTIILEKKGLKGTSYSLVNQELHSFYVGNFVLDIVAYIEYAETEIVKKSRITRVPFSLAVNISKEAPKILTDELQYGE